MVSPSLSLEKHGGRVTRGKDAKGYGEKIQISFWLFKHQRRMSLKLSVWQVVMCVWQVPQAIFSKILSSIWWFKNREWGYLSLVPLSPSLPFLGDIMAVFSASIFPKNSRSLFGAGHLLRNGYQHLGHSTPSLCLECSRAVFIHCPSTAREPFRTLQCVCKAIKMFILFDPKILLLGTNGKKAIRYLQ